MNNFSVGYADDLKNGRNSHGEAIILNPSRRDTTIIHYSFKFQIYHCSRYLTSSIFTITSYLKILPRDLVGLGGVVIWGNDYFPACISATDSRMASHMYSSCSALRP